MIKQLQVRLNQIVTKKDIKLRNVGSMHAVSNSIKRNTMYNSNKTQLPVKTCMASLNVDQNRLPHVRFGRKDMSLILRYLYSKEEMTVGDRNFIRRIMLSIFDQEIVCAGGPDLVTMLEYSIDYTGFKKEMHLFNKIYFNLSFTL